MNKSAKIIAVLIIFFSLTMTADPVVIKGVDGSWIPVLIQSWNEKGGGVLLEPAQGVKNSELRTKLIELFPNMSIEIIGNTLFFSSTNVTSLFNILNKVETGITLPSTGEKLLKNKDMPIFKKKPEKHLDKEKVVESVVTATSFSKEKELFFIDILIKKRAEKGEFHRYYGRQRLAVPFTFKDSVVDPQDPKNLRYAPLLFLKKDDKLNFIPKRIKGKKFLRIEAFRMFPKEK
jgi:hypothetical protein